MPLAHWNPREGLFQHPSERATSGRTFSFVSPDELWIPRTQKATRHRTTVGTPRHKYHHAQCFRERSDPMHAARPQALLRGQSRPPSTPMHPRSPRLHERSVWPTLEIRRRRRITTLLPQSTQAWMIYLPGGSLVHNGKAPAMICYGTFNQAFPVLCC